MAVGCGQEVDALLWIMGLRLYFATSLLNILFHEALVSEQPPFTFYYVAHGKRHASSAQDCLPGSTGFRGE